MATASTVNPEIALQVRRFWAAAGIVPSYPVDLTSVACLALPLGVVHLPDLTTEALDAWFGSAAPRPNLLLHGALLARRGRGLILVDSRDSLDEQRMSIAHECGHFIFDYLEPRKHVVRVLGNKVLEILDGDRSPTAVERVDSLLAGVPLGHYIHFIEKRLKDDSYEVLRAESIADAFALELVAPTQDAVRRSKGLTSIEILSELLARDFGIPLMVARSYGRSLLLNQSLPIREWLGLQ
ncbi:MAG: ImmA/IrrE family metallo-endopeptidase [Thermomicrobiales bacterium]